MRTHIGLPVPNQDWHMEDCNGQGLIEQGTGDCGGQIMHKRGLGLTWVTWVGS